MLTQFVVEYFWIILVILIMLTYNKRMAIIISALCWVLPNPNAAVEKVLIVICIILSFVVMTDAYYKGQNKKEYHGPNHDPDYD